MTLIRKFASFNGNEALFVNNLCNLERF